VGVGGEREWEWEAASRNEVGKEVLWKRLGWGQVARTWRSWLQTGLDRVRVGVRLRMRVKEKLRGRVKEKVSVGRGRGQGPRARGVGMAGEGAGECW
jgi:hypothetical protein